MQTDFLIPSGTLKQGKNQLRITCRNNAPADDIHVGHITIHPAAPEALRRGATLQLAIMNQDQMLIPGRITLTSRAGTLLPISTKSGNGLAIREGVVYTASGQANLTLAPGEYKITAGRGFEYSIASALINIAAGETVKRTLILERQVETENWIACDTHVHTVTHSGHGDCTIEERMATLAGEGIELPIATDHNKQIDYRPTMAETETKSFFTPLIGNEVTTNFGHFNAFPFSPDATIPDYKENDWSVLIPSILKKPDVKVVILNHARDIHSGSRPFAPENFNDAHRSFIK